tara:strand:+ start:52 stop:435 length:384 start_codon:yes stop_codon:yes gene_type:complete
LVNVLSRNLKFVHPTSNAARFQEFVHPKLEALALKARAKIIADGLFISLPNDYPAAIEILVKSMDIPLKDEDELGRYSEFYFLPFAEYIATYGRNHLSESMHANYKLTKVFTAEFSVRYFIENYPQE